MSALWPHTGVLLNGGASRRMDGIPKASLTDDDGRTFAQRAADVLRATCAQVVISGHDGDLNLPVIPDTESGAGPLAAVRSVLDVMEDEAALFCPVDLPAITPAVLSRLTETYRMTSAPAVAFHVDGESAPRPLPLVIQRSMRGVVDRALTEGERSLRRMLTAVAVERVPMTVSEADDALFNVNSPADLAIWRERSRARSH